MSLIKTTLITWLFPFLFLFGRQRNWVTQEEGEEEEELLVKQTTWKWTARRRTATKASSNCTTYVYHRFRHSATGTTPSGDRNWVRPVCDLSGAVTSATLPVGVPPLRAHPPSWKRRHRCAEAPCPRSKTSTWSINTRASSFPPLSPFSIPSIGAFTACCNPPASSTFLAHLLQKKKNKK